MTSRPIVRAAIALVVLLFAAAPVARALTADELLLIANKNDSDSMELARFYANARFVPQGHTLGLDLPKSEEISFDDYETKIVPAVRAYLREHGLQDKVKCLVTFYGTPLRINGKKTTA